MQGLFFHAKTKTLHPQTKTPTTAGVITAWFFEIFISSSVGHLLKKKNHCKKPGKCAVSVAPNFL